MKPLQFDAEYGFFDLTIGEVTLKMDLWKLNNELAIITNGTHKDSPLAERTDAVCDYIAKLGFPRPSHAIAVKIMDAVSEMMEVERGKDKPAQEPTQLPA